MSDVPQWRFTSDGEPAYYQQTGEEMPGYRPGTVAGSITASDSWQLLVATKFWLRAINEKVDRENNWDMPPYDWEDYLWKIEARTHFLYSDPDLGPELLDQRVVSGAFGVTDELNWMGFSGMFSGDELEVLVLEVDTSWSTAISVTREDFGGKAAYQLHLHDTQQAA